MFHPGRTARIGNKGLATSLFNDRNTDIGPDLVKVLLECEQTVPEYLQGDIPEDGKIEFHDDTDDEDEEDAGGWGGGGDGGWGASNDDGGDGAAANNGWGASNDNNSNGWGASNKNSAVGWGASAAAESAPADSWTQSAAASAW